MKKKLKKTRKDLIQEKRASFDRKSEYEKDLIPELASWKKKFQKNSFTCDMGTTEEENKELNEILISSNYVHKFYDSEDKKVTDIDVNIDDSYLFTEYRGDIIVCTNGYMDGEFGMFPIEWQKK